MTYREFTQSAMMVALAVAIGCALAIASCALLLPLLRRLQWRQRVYEDAPQTHQVKTGTPTMGGICFVVALLMLAIEPIRGVLGTDLLGLVTACAAVGFIDDILAVRFGRNRGLRARTKLLMTALIAVMFLRAIDGSSLFFPRDVLFTTGSGALQVPHWLWLLLGIAAITGTIHAVNLTDGLDGLAAGTMIFPLAALAAVAFARVGAWGEAFSFHVVLLPALLGAGACLGFLVYNHYPAKLIMGDTGSLALGALLSGIAILSGEMLLLLIVGGVFVAEALSVMVQVTYFKLTGGKRVFKMSPLHHHFELSGWPETRVTLRFWLASALCSAIGWAIVK